MESGQKQDILENFTPLDLNDKNVNYFEWVAQLLKIFFGSFFSFIGSITSATSELILALLMAPTNFNLTLPQSAYNLSRKVVSKIDFTNVSIFTGGAALFTLVGYKLNMNGITATNLIKGLVESVSNITFGTILQQTLAPIFTITPDLQMKLDSTYFNLINSYLVDPTTLVNAQTKVVKIKQWFLTATTTVQLPSWFEIGQDYLLKFREMIKYDQCQEFIFNTYASISTFAIRSPEAIKNLFESAKVKMLQNIDALVNNTTETAVPALQYISSKLNVGATWLDENIPLANKVFSATKTWLTTTVKYIYSSLIGYTGEKNLILIAWAAGLMVTGVMATWLVKKIYNTITSKSKSTNVSDKYLEEFGVLSLLTSGYVTSVTNILLPTNESKNVKIKNLKQATISFANTTNQLIQNKNVIDMGKEILNNIQPILNLTGNENISQVAYEVTVNLKQVFENECIKLLQLNNEKVIEFVDKIKKQVEIPLLSNKSLLVKKSKNKKVPYTTDDLQIQNSVVELAQTEIRRTSFRKPTNKKQQKKYY
jgi:hypothetical protein